MIWKTSKTDHSHEQFQKNDEATNDLMSMHKTTEEHADTMMRVLEHTAEEYCSEASRLEDLLETCCLNDSSFSKAGKQALDSLVAGASLLGLGTTSESGFFAAIQELEKKHGMVRYARIQSEHKLSKLQQSCDQNRRSLDQLQSYAAEIEKGLEDATRSNMDSLRHEIQSFSKKYKKYRLLEQGHQLELNQHGLSGRGEPTGHQVRHNQIVDVRMKITKMEEKLKGMEKNLAKYYSLPPDETLARMELEDAKSHLAKVDVQFSSAVDQL